MPDAIEATIKLMESKSENITIRSSYNLSGVNFNPQEIANEISKHVPDFEIIYKPDYRQKLQIHGLNQLMIVMQKMIGTGNQNTI